MLRTERALIGRVGWVGVVAAVPATASTTPSPWPSAQQGCTVYVTGTSSGSSSGLDYATIAYNAATGAQQWVKRCNSPGNSSDVARAVTASADGTTVYVTGKATEAFGADYATIAYNASIGSRLWLTRDNGTGNSTDIAFGLAASPKGNTVYVTGLSSGATNSDYATIAYNG